MLITIGPLGEMGVVKDSPAHLLPFNAWTEAENVSFQDGKVVRSPGYSSALTPSISPIYAQFCPTATGSFWLYAGTAAVYATDGATHADITRTVGGAYAATADLNWTGGNLGGIPVINNGIDPPQMWNTPALATPLAALTNWPASTLCQSLRPFKNFLVALDITEGVTRYPQMIRWSHPADPGAVPASWDYTNPSYDAGRIELRETSDFLVDQFPLRDINVLYKESSVWAMRYIAGNDIFAFSKLFDSIGIMSKRCVLEFESGRHVVFTPDDCLIHDGQSAQSLIQKKLRRTLFSEINSSKYKRCFVTASWLTQEVFFCYPENSQDYCTRALVWNWKENTLSFRDLPSITHVGIGVIDLSSAAPSTWDTASGTWDTSTSFWDYSGVRAADRRMMLVKPGSALYGAPVGLSAAGSTIVSFARRESLGLPAKADGPPDFTSRKLVKRLWPHIDGDVGAVVKIYVGVQERIDDAVVWTGPYLFTVGTTKFIDCLLNARLHSFEFVCEENKNWSLSSMDIEYSFVGGL